MSKPGTGAEGAEALPSEPTPGALAAVSFAEQMSDQTNPAIWFDSWSNDLRDNDLDGKIDNPTEGGAKNGDGTHYGHAYKAKVAPVAGVTTDHAPEWTLKTIDVLYKVCIDVPIESYVAAHVPISRNRWIPAFFKALKHMPGWRVWDDGQRPTTLMDGDIVAAKNAQHQHAGIVKTGIIYDSVINLPGPTSARKYGVFMPSGLNDMCSVPRSLFEGVLGIDCYARWIGTAATPPGLSRKP